MEISSQTRSFETIEIIYSYLFVTAGVQIFPNELTCTFLQCEGS